MIVSLLRKYEKLNSYESRVTSWMVDNGLPFVTSDADNSSTACTHTERGRECCCVLLQCRCAVAAVQCRCGWVGSNREHLVLKEVILHVQLVQHAQRW